MKKGIVALLICVSLVFGAETASAAAKLPDFEIAHPMIQECGNCGQMRLMNYTEYTSWSYLEMRTCQKLPSKSDTVYSRLKYEGVKCSNCGYKKQLSTTIEYNTVCNH